MGVTPTPFITLPTNSWGPFVLKLGVCAARHTHLVEERTVCYGNTQRGEAPADHHVIWSVIAVAAATAGEEPGHSRAAEHHPAHVETQCKNKQTNKQRVQKSVIDSRHHKRIPLPASPSAPCGVAVSVAKQAIAVSLPEAHCFLRVVATQQPAQPGQAGQNIHTDQQPHSLDKCKSKDCGATVGGTMGILNK